MALPDGPIARVLKPRRDDRLTVAEVIERLQQMPPYYPTIAVDVIETAPEFGGPHVVDFLTGRESE